MLCLITGAAGFVGSHLAEHLCRQGHDVLCLVRPTSSLAWLAGLPVRFAYGDVTDRASLEPAVAAADRVFHVAGLTKALRRADFDRVNAAGTANVLAACAAAGRSGQRVVVVTSLAALGPSPDGRPLPEDAPPRPVSPYGQSKLRAEAVAASYADRLPITVVRPPAIYGPRDRELLPVFQAADRGLLPLPRPRLLASLIEVRDLARGLALAAERPAAVGRTYHLASPEPLSQEELVALVAETLGRRPVVVRLPAAAFLAAGAANELYGRLRRQPRIFDRSKARELAQSSWVCDSRRARDELGFEATTSAREGIQQTAEWYRQAGWLR